MRIGFRIFLIKDFIARLSEVLRRGDHALRERIAKLLELKRIKGVDVEEHIRGLRELSESVIDEKRAGQAAKIFSALADPIRIRILKLIEAERALCVCELVAALGVRQPLVSYHLRILRESGLVKPVKKGRWVFYEVADKRLMRLISRIIELSE